MVEKSGGEKSGIEKSGVEKFGDEMSCNHSEAFYYCDQLGGALAEPTNNLRQAVLAGLASDLAIDPGLDHWWIGKYNHRLKTKRRESRTLLIRPHVFCLDCVFHHNF